MGHSNLLFPKHPSGVPDQPQKAALVAKGVAEMGGRAEWTLKVLRITHPLVEKRLSEFPLDCRGCVSVYDMETIQLILQTSR